MLLAPDMKAQFLLLVPMRGSVEPIPSLLDARLDALGPADSQCFNSMAKKFRLCADRGYRRCGHLKNGIQKTRTNLSVDDVLYYGAMESHPCIKYFYRAKSLPPGT